MFTVRVEWYSLEPHRVGTPTGEFREFKHRTLKAAKRRLGSIIAGKQQHLARSLGGRDGVRLFIVTPQGANLTWTAARNIIEDGAA